MNMHWIAALISPDYVGKHPNFSDPQGDSGPARLANFILDAGWPSERAAGSVRGSDIELWEGMAEHLTSWTSGASEEAARSLSTMSERLGETNPAVGAICSIFSAIAYSESDLMGECIRTLDLSIDALRSNHPSEECACELNLLLSLMLCQRAFRSAEIGLPALTYIDAAHATLDKVEASTLPTFPIARGSEISPLSLNSGIIAYIRESISQVESALPDRREGLIVDLLKAEPTLIASRRNRRAATGLKSVLDNAFSQAIRKEKLANPSATDELWSALLQAEIIPCGGTTRRARVELGMARYLYSENMNVEWNTETLRLLRQGADPNKTEDAYRLMRLDGPLEAVRGDLKGVVRRAAGQTLRRTDLIAVKIAGDTIDSEYVPSVLDSILELSRGMPNRGVQFSNQPGQKDVVGAIGALTGHLPNEAILGLHEFVIQHGHELYDVDCSRIVESMDWAHLPTSTQTLWADWARDNDSVMPELISAVLRASSDRYVELTSDKASPVQKLAHLFNTLVVQEGVAFPAHEIAPSSDLILTELNEITNRARRGADAFGGRNIADIAVGLVLEFDGFEALLPDLSSFLANTSIPRHHTMAAIDRIARFSGHIPEELTSQLIREGPELLAWRSVSFVDDRQTEALAVSPEILRFLIRMEGIDSDHVFEHVTRLSTGSWNAKVEAVETLNTLCRFSDVPPWGAFLASQLTHDTTPVVVFRAVRLLSTMYVRDASASDRVEKEIAELLDADGTGRPLAVLSGLTSAGKESGGTPAVSISIQSRLQRMTRAHVDRQIRDHAQRTLATFSSQHLPM